MYEFSGRTLERVLAASEMLLSEVKSSERSLSLFSSISLRGERMCSLTSFSEFER